MSSESAPASQQPARSPFTSERKTGTPISLKDSASTFKLTVFPVPVAPAIRPWRFAIFGRIETLLPSSASFSTQSLSSNRILPSPSLPLLHKAGLSRSASQPSVLIKGAS